MDDRYFAGLFDGEGYVRINRWAKPNSIHVRYNLMVGIGMTYRPIIEALQERYGGSINMNRHDLRNSNARIQYTWNVASQKAATFLRRIHPFVIVKRDEVDIALAFQKHIDDNPYRRAQWPNRDAIFATRHSMYERIAALKKRSFPPLTA